MTCAGRTRILAALGAVVALSLTGPVHGAPAATGKAATKPVVGDCHKLTVDEALAKTDTSSPVDCKQAHNTRVIAVRNLPHGATYDDLTRPQFFAAAAKICQSAFLKAVSKNYLVVDRTSYTYVFFQPTKKEMAAGARWVRCDLALLHGRTYGDLPTNAVPAVKGSRVPDSAKRCLTSRHFYVTTCTASHTYRATGSFNVPHKKFPGTKAMIRIGQARCPAHVSSRHFRFTWKTKPNYNKYHDHVIVCFTQTRR